MPTKTNKDMLAWLKRMFFREVLPLDGPIYVPARDLAIIVPYSGMRDDVRAMPQELQANGHIARVDDILFGSIDQHQGLTGYRRQASGRLPAR